MIPSNAKFEIPVAHPQPPKTDLRKSLATNAMILYNHICRILTLAARAMHGRLVMPLCQLWDHYYPRVAHVEERVVMPPSALSFIIIVLLAFAEIKSQGHADFPFKTHPLLVRFSVGSVVMYGLFYAAKLVASGLDSTCVFVHIAGLGKICSLCILVISLACLFYF